MVRNTGEATAVIEERDLLLFRLPLAQVVPLNKYLVQSGYNSLLASLQHLLHCSLE